MIKTEIEKEIIDNRNCLNPFPCPYHGHDARTCDECIHFGYGYWDDEESEDSE